MTMTGGISCRTPNKKEHTSPAEYTIVQPSGLNRSLPE